MARWFRAPSLLLPVATGVLLALSFPPLHLVLPPFVALAPLAVHLDRAGARGEGVGAAFRAGAAAGGVAWTLLLAWIPPALLAWSWVALPGWVLAVGALAALTGGVAAAVHALRFGAGLPLALALPLAWTAGEWLRAHLPGPLAFPWLELGISLTGRPEWLGIAEVVGGRGVSFWLATVSGLLAWAWRRGEAAEGRDGSPAAAAAPPLAAALALAAAVPAGGIVRARALETRPVARVAVVQPDVTRRSHPDPGAMAEAVGAALARLAPEVRAGAVRGAAVELVVLPEAVLPDTLGTPGGGRAEAVLSAFADRVGAPVLAGSLTSFTSPGAPGDPVVRNSVVLVDGAGRRSWRYDKHHLVPLVERTPLPPLPGVGEGFAGYGPGRGWPLARLAGGVSVGAFVCYESAFPGVARALAAAGADLLVNVTNDGWFGGPGGRTHALWQHPAHLVMRAVETRTGIARAASTGFSFFVDPAGRIEGRTDLFEEAVSVAMVTAVRGDTVFTRRGDVTGAGSMAATTLLLLAVGLRRPRHIGRRGG